MCPSFSNEDTSAKIHKIVNNILAHDLNVELNEENVKELNTHDFELITDELKKIPISNVKKRKFKFPSKYKNRAKKKTITTAEIQKVFGKIGLRFYQLQIYLLKSS